MKIKLLAAVLIWGWGFGNTVFAQKENYVWYFGDHAGLDFNSGGPVALTNGMLYTFEGCSSISDTNGNLLFYTNGIRVWDKNHNQMPNGDGLLGSSSSTQSGLIVPYPGNPLLYYIFTVEDIFSIGLTFRYSIVDMSQNNNNGDVTIKNNFILAPVTEKLTAVKHANGNDFWVMVHGLNNNNFYCYLVSSAGLDTTPVISSIGPIIFDLSVNLDSEGYLKFSPDGSSLAYAGVGNTYVDLFAFDSSTGIVSNEKYLTLPASPNNGAYGLEFSPSGNYLYTTIVAQPKLYQWDISSGSAAIINSTLQFIDSIHAPQGTALQLGPDGKIYVATEYAEFLGNINFPEMPGIQCNFIDSGVSLNGRSSLAGLPNFITSYFLPTGINTTNPQQNQLTISPNPATDKIYISFPATASEDIITKIYSITGEVVYKKLYQSFKTLEKVIDVTGLSNGIYFLNVQTGREMVTKKIVVNH